MSETERQERFEAALASAPARWCSAAVERLRPKHDELGMYVVPANVAAHFAGTLAENVVTSIYKSGLKVESLTEDAWRIRALLAWSRLQVLGGRLGGSDEIAAAIFDEAVGELLDAAESGYFND